MNDPNPLRDLGAALARAVHTAAPSVVRVEGRRGRPSSGIVWEEGGLVLAASHAVGRGDTGVVVVGEGHRLDVRLLARDAGTDVAVLRLEQGALPPARLVEPDGVEAGHVVLALGRPGRAIRASLRIVGLVGPAMDTGAGGHLDRYLESDRGLPPGFEGGPLVDADGAVLGLNTSALLHGADLTIPVPTLRRVVREVLARAGAAG